MDDRKPKAPTASLVLKRAATTQTPVKDVPPVVNDTLRSQGHPLDAATRAFMEPRFGYDFSGVRVHSDGKSAESARAVNAMAYTVGEDVVFGKGNYAPETARGSELMAHELAHVVQQSRGGMSSQPERQADAAADSLSLGQTITPNLLGGAPRSLQLKPDKESDAPVNDKPAADPGKFSNNLDKFALNSADLTGDHLQTIDTLVNEIANRLNLAASGRATITVIGHTDTSGDEKYNKILGLKRANAAKAALEAAMKAKKISSDRLAGIGVDSTGEKNLAKETDDNVREPLNRRVEIIVKVEGAQPLPPVIVTNTPGPLLPDEKKPIDFYHLPPGYKLPEESWWKRTQREIDKVQEYDRTHPSKPKSPTDVLVEGITNVLEPIIKQLPKGLQDLARTGIRKGVEAGTEKACDASIDASGVTGPEADAMKSACKAALKMKPGENKKE